MNYHKKYELKIESGINGGSFSLWSDGIQNDFLMGDRNAEKSDYLIENVSVLLRKNNAEKSEIKKIIYSDYPVSQTGLKILRSILKGFATVYPVDIDNKNLFDSIWIFFQKTETENERKLIVLPSTTTKFEFVLFDKFGEKQSTGIFGSRLLNETLDKTFDPQAVCIYALEENMQMIESEINASEILLNPVFIKLDKNLSRYL